MARRKAAAAFQNIDKFACLDFQREHRTGIPEVVIAEGKRKDHTIAIARKLLESKGRVIVTRVPLDLIPSLRFKGSTCMVHRDARICVLKRKGFKVPKTGALVVILAAGTSDYSIGEEARIVAQELGVEVLAFYDIGVAGVHRLFKVLKGIDPDKVGAYIVLAGREGALPTLVAGLVDAPVIGVPVSTGYGKGGKGEAALMAMLQSCSPLVVVNIDAGFIAGVMAARIATRMVRKMAQKGAKSAPKAPKIGQKRKNR